MGLGKKITGDAILFISYLLMVVDAIDLFKWVAEQWPCNMLEVDRDGETPLHYACWMLAGNHFQSGEICRYLIEHCPESVRISGDQRRLPIRILLDRCQHQFVKEVVVCLLRAYPESYDVAAQTDIGDVP